MSFHPLLGESLSFLCFQLFACFGLHTTPESRSQEPSEEGPSYAFDRQPGRRASQPQHLLHNGARLPARSQRAAGRPVGVFLNSYLGPPSDEPRSWGHSSMPMSLRRHGMHGMQLRLGDFATAKPRSLHSTPLRILLIVNHGVEKRNSMSNAWSLCSSRVQAASRRLLHDRRYDIAY